jgi:hypothetical protein
MTYYANEGIFRLSPLKGSRLLVMCHDESHQALNQLIPRLEDAAANDFAGENAEPDFNLIQPTRVSWGEGQMEALVFCNPGQGFLAAMR